MQSALRHSGLSPSDIAYVNAHATSTPIGDAAELAALEHVFAECGEQGKPVAVSSTKGHVGHLLGAAGAVEAIFALKALQEGVLLPNLNLDDPMETVGAVRLVTEAEQTGVSTFCILSVASDCRLVLVELKVRESVLLCFVCRGQSAGGDVQLVRLRWHQLFTHIQRLSRIVTASATRHCERHVFLLVPR